MVVRGIALSRWSFSCGKSKLRFFISIGHGPRQEDIKTAGSRKGSGFRGFGSVPHTIRWTIYLSGFIAISTGYLMTVITAYLPELGFSANDVGLIVGATGISIVVAALPMGILSDRVGRKKVLLFGLALIVPVLLAYVFSKDVTILLIAALLTGLAEGAFLSSWNALIADHTQTENRDAAFALSFLINSALTGVGFALPLLFPSIEALTGWSSLLIHNLTLIVLAVLTTLSFFALAWLLRDLKEERVAREKNEARGDLRPLMRFSITNFFIGLGAGFIIPIIPTWLFLKFGITDTLSGPLLALSAITMAFAVVLSARIAFHYGPVKAIVMTQGSSTIFMVLIPFMPGATLAASMYVVRSVLMNMAGPIGDSFLMGIIPKGQRGLASAINSIIWRLPNSVTTVFGGLLLAGGFYELPFLIAATFYIIAISAFYLLFKDMKPLN